MNNNNPIAQAMKKSNSSLSGLSQLASILKGDPNAAYQNMLKTNPQFAKFVEDNKNKPIEQVAKENGIDPQILDLFK